MFFHVIFSKYRNSKNWGRRIQDSLTNKIGIFHISPHILNLLFDYLAWVQYSMVISHSNLYGIDEMEYAFYSKTPTVFGIQDTHRWHNATVEESGSKVRLFNGFIKVVNYAIVALWPMDAAANLKWVY